MYTLHCNGGGWPEKVYIYDRAHSWNCIEIDEILAKTVFPFFIWTQLLTNKKYTFPGINLNTPTHEISVWFAKWNICANWQTWCRVCLFTLDALMKKNKYVTFPKLSLRKSIWKHSTLNSFTIRLIFLHLQFSHSP